MPAPGQETNQRTMTLRLQHNLWAPLEVQEDRRSAGRVRIQSQPVAKSAIEFQQFERQKLVPTVFRTHSGPAILQSNLHTLPSRDSAAYRFRNTIAYWVAVFFAEGSLLFVVGASSSMVVESEWRRLGLIEYSYFAGSIFFTLGAYMGFFEVINVGRHAEGSGLRFFSLSGTSVEGYWVCRRPQQPESATSLSALPHTCHHAAAGHFPVPRRSAPLQHRVRVRAPAKIV